MPIQGIQAGLNYGSGLSALNGAKPRAGVALPVRSPASNNLFASSSVSFASRLDMEAGRLTQLKESVAFGLDALSAAKKDLGDLRKLTQDLRAKAVGALGGTEQDRADATAAFNTLRDAVDSFVQNNGSGLVGLLSDRPTSVSVGSGESSDFADRILEKIGETLTDRGVSTNVADRVLKSLSGAFDRIFSDRAPRNSSPSSNAGATATEISVSAGLGFVRAPNNFATDSDVEVALSALDQAIGKFNAIDIAVGTASSFLTQPIEQMMGLNGSAVAAADRLSRARQSDSDIGFALLNTRAGLSGSSQALAPSSELKILGLFANGGRVGPASILA